jgi:hypothetical protein
VIHKHPFPNQAQFRFHWQAFSPNHPDLERTTTRTQNPTLVHRG